MSEASTSAAPATPANPCPKCGAPIPPEAPQGLCPKCLLQQASFPTETGATTRHTRPAPPNRDELARAFPHLQILELIGQGGMGFVYKARQPKLDRLVALKILAQPLAEQTHFAERFTREGRTLAKLSHPNIVTIHDFGQAGPFFYLLMEYVDGVNLRQAMRAGAIDSAQALAIVPRICEALQYAHNEGVLHRDIKPDNILLDTRGRVKIADFGIAKLMAEAVAENPLTGSGASLGTPHYMAPEQIEKPNAVDHRADIYSLGVVFYEMLTGELPLGRFAAPSETSGNDPRLDEIVFQTLEKQPDRRPQSADEVKTRVETISAAPQSSSATEPPVTFKMTRCSLTTPKLLHRHFGPFFRFLHKGDLRLDSENLTFVPRGNWIVMPLRAITSLSLVEFPTSTVTGLPWQNAIPGLKLIAVTFTEKGVQHRFLLYPKPGHFIPPTERNRQAEEWFTAIQNAIKARTGRIPPSSNKDCEPLPSEAPSTFLDAALKKIAAATMVVLLMVIAFLSYLALIKQPAPLSPQPLKPPKIAINVTAVTVTNVQHIALWTTTDTAADEVFVPVVRYDEGPWSQSDVARKYLEWTTDKAGVHHLGRYDWTVPSGFNSEFQMAAAAAAARARAESGPFPLTIEPTVVFAITNQSGQRFSGGLRLKEIPAPPHRQNPVATIKDLYIYGDSRGEHVLRGEGRLDIPQGYRVVARALNGNEALTARALRSADWDGFEWHGPSITGGGNKPLVHFAFLEIKPGAQTEVYSIPNTDFDFHAYLELVPLEGLISAAANLPAPNQNHTATVLKTNLPATSAESKKNSSPLAELLNISLNRRSVEPRRIFMEAHGPLTLDQSIVAVVNYPTFENPANPSRRLPRPISSPSFGFGGGLGTRIPNDPTSIWRKQRGATNYEGGDLIWDFKETFSLEHDLTPAVDRFFGKQNEKKIQLTADQPTVLFRMTNAFGEVAECAIEFVKTEAAVKDSSAGVIVTSLSGFTNGAVIVGDFAVAFPKNFDVQASGVADGKPTTTFLTRNMTQSGAIECRWLYPEGFLPAQETATNQTPTKSTTPTPIPAPAYYSLPSLFERLNQRARAGDARVTASEPLEVFAITNAENKIFRGFLEIQPNRSAGAAPQGSDDRRGVSSSASQENPLASKVTKIFEFNSVTNASNYIVLRTDTPMPPGQTLTALIEDSSGNTVRGISSLAIVHKRDETNTSSGLMWNTPEGAAADWIDSSLQQIKDNVLGRQFKISEGQTIRLFKFPAKRDGLEKFAAVRLDHAHSADPTPPASLQLRSVFPLQGGFILHFSGDVPNGCRLEAICEPRVNDAEGRLDASHIQGNYFYNAMWTFDRFHSQNLGESLVATLTNQFNALKDAPILINPGESKTLFTIKTPNKEFRAILKLATPNER